MAQIPKPEMTAGAQVPVLQFGLAKQTVGTGLALIFREYLVRIF